jgi:hypothetical protein
MIGSDIVSQDELGASMYVVYHVMNNDDKTETQKRLITRAKVSVVTLAGLF